MTEDLLSGLAAKDIALATNEYTYAAWLKEARNCAHRYAGIHGTVTSDDVHRLCPPPPWVHHNAMGGIFRTRAFVSVGFVQSKRPSAHARMIREYVLRGA